LVILMAVVSLLRRDPVLAPGGKTFAASGVVGGVLGATTSLNGVVPALVMSQARVPNRQFLADLAVYFVGSSVVGLVAVTVGGVSAPHAFEYFLVSVPLSVLANQLGLTWGAKLPQRVFRVVTIVVVICAGVAAIPS